MRAQDIADEILSSERMANSRVFADRVYSDEPILRTGAQFVGRDKRAQTHSSDRPHARSMPVQYSRMREFARAASMYGRHSYSYGAGGSRIFYEQAKYMEDFEDDFEGNCQPYRLCGTYEDLSDYDLRCYFTWRSHFRAGETSQATPSFLYIYAHEVLCGIGVDPGEGGFAELERLYRAYAGTSASFESHLSRWKHDYVIYHGLNKSLVHPTDVASFTARVMLLATAQRILLDHDMAAWPEKASADLPSAPDVLDALCALSRYRADKSRFIRDHRDDVAEVCCHVFARMVWHCHKRRKIDYIEGLFGGPVRISYTMYPSAIFWTPDPHEDVEYEMGEAETYICERGFWWRRVPFRRFETSKELGALMHAIDARMRVALGDAHPLKERSLPKYQGKIVDEEIAALIERRKAEEAARIHIDRSSLGGIRSASARTREALLTDEEREENEWMGEPATLDVPSIPTSLVDTEENVSEAQPEGHAQSPLGLDGTQTSLLGVLLGNGETETWNSLELSLAVDAINEAFLDVLGDTIIEFDGDVPILVEDYEQDVRELLGYDS